MKGFTIREDANEIRESEDVEFQDAWLTPEEAENQIVAFEPPGRMGREVFRIVDVNLEENETLLQNVHTGNEYVVDDGFLPPNYDHFRRPWIGEKFTVAWKEHLRGNGEWVRTTRKMNSEYEAYTYYGQYQGHEETRVVEKTFDYTPPGIIKERVWYDQEDGFEIHYDGELENADTVFGVLDEDSIDGFDSFGEVFIDQDGEIVYYDLEEQYLTSVEERTSVFETLENPVI